MLRGKPLSVLLWLAWPAMIAGYVTISYNFIDSLWLGRLGKLAFSAPTVSWPLVYLLVAIGSGYIAGGLSIISQYNGAGKFEKTRESAGSLFTLSLLLSFLLAYPPAFFANRLLEFMGVPSDVLPFATVYLRVVLLATPLAYIGISFTMIAHAIGDTRTPTWINASSSIMNMILDPLLIFGLLGFPKLGVLGAALATAISRGYTAVVAVLLLFHFYDKLRLDWSHLGIKREMIYRMNKVGIPLAIQRASNNLGMVILVSIISSFHAVAIAAYGIGIRVIELFQGFSNGMSRATSILVGNNIGAGERERAYNIVMIAYKFVLAVFVFGATAIISERYDIASLFIKETSVVNEGGAALLLFSLSLPFYGIYYVSSGVASGSGHTKVMTLISIIRLWVLRILLAFILAYIVGLGSMGVWAAISISNIGAGVMSLVWVKRKRWLEGIFS